MIERVTVHPSTYHDSVTLMLISRDASGIEGVEDLAAVTGTPLNLTLLAQLGYDLSRQSAGPNDLVIAVRAVDEPTADVAIAAVEERLSASRAPAGSLDPAAAPRSLAAAVRHDPDLRLALLSVPGRHVAYEAALALRNGLHVFCFSDGVALEDEISLKARALERDLLFMGPDCGTAVLDGLALGFANVVDRGPVGLVGASGTGLQQIMCLLDAAGVGISQAIGVGGRDLSAAVGGRMSCRALELLGEDPETEAVVIVSKPPDPAVAEMVSAVARELSKPVVFAFLGEGAAPASGEGMRIAQTLEAAAAAAAELVGAQPHRERAHADTAVPDGYIRGLFCGGTLCDEAMTIAARAVGRVSSNIPLRPEWALKNIARSEGHTFIDFGDDEFTQGRAHPMIDPSLRTERLAREARDPEVGVILLDVILGIGAHRDPAAGLAPVVAEALERRGSGLRIVVSLCGTERDPQGLSLQCAALEAAGALVLRSNAHAARLAVGSQTLAEV